MMSTWHLLWIVPLSASVGFAIGFIFLALFAIGEKRP